MSTITKDLGVVTAYGYAVTKGYEGTEEEFAELMASYATVAAQAAQSAQTATQKAEAAALAVLEAVSAKDSAVQAKTDAETARDSAAGSASSASQSASSASASATSASGSAQTAVTKANEANTSAENASQSATSAQTAKTDAQTAKADAETAKAEAETAQAKAEEAQAKAEKSADDLSAEVEQIETNKNDIANLKSDLSQITIQEEIEPNNLLNPDNISSGYYWSNGWNESSSYSNTGYIPVKSGKTYSLWTNAHSGTFRKVTMRFVVSYDSDKNVLNTYSDITDVAPQTSEKYIIISAVPAALTSQGMVTALAENVTYEPYFEPHKNITINMDKVDAYTKEEIDSLKFVELFIQLELSEALNLYNKDTSQNGYIPANGAVSESTTYCYSAKIPVEVGNTYTFWALYNGAVVSANARFLCAYDKDGNAVTASGSNSAVSNYTVPDGIATIAISFEQNRRHLFMVVVGSEQPSGLLPYNEEHYIAKASFISKAFGELSRGNEFIKLTAESVSANQEKVLATHIDNKKNCAYSFFGRFSSFSSVEIGHGKTETGACYMIVDATNVTTYSPSGSIYSQQAHGLTISDFIAVSIKVADTKTARATVNIITNGGSVLLNNIIFFGCNGSIYFKCGQTTTGCTFTYNIMDLRKDVFVFGDSYTSLASDARWPEYAITNNDNNMLLSGFAGAKSAEEYPSFENIIQMKKPKYLCWFLGMNDPDKSGQIDSTWVTTVSQVLAECDKNGVIPILATIPNTPTQRNIEKNEWVKASGRRYVDFASAVGASEADSAWYNGMLSSDNVHPTAEGAKALWLQLRMDVPEIMNPTT